VHPRPLPLQRHEPRPGGLDLTQRYSRLVRGAIVLLAGLAFAASANAAPPAVTATATPAAGVAPFRVTLTATGDAASYSWALGDAPRGHGPGRHACLRAGKFIATVTATNAAGEVSQAQVVVTGSKRALTLAAPRAPATASPPSCAGSCSPRSAAAESRSTAAERSSPPPRRRERRFRAGSSFACPGPTTLASARLGRPSRIVRLRPTIEAPLLGDCVVGST
jgi:hypothetical protein